MTTGPHRHWNLPETFLEEISGSYNDLLNAPQGSSVEQVCARLNAAAVHCRNIYCELLNVQQVCSKPGSISTDDPRGSQRQQVADIREIIEMVDQSLSVLKDIGMPTESVSAAELNQVLAGRMRSASEELDKSEDGAVAALDALEAVDASPWIFTERPNLRRSLIASLGELAKQMSALGTAFSEIAARVRDWGDSTRTA